MRKRIRILVADDNAMVRESLRHGFQGTEVEVVVEAATGREAVSAAREQTLDLVLLDVQMPDGNGLQALEWIGSQLPGLPVLMYSMHISRDHALRSRELGAAGYLIKGCPLETLLQAIRAVAEGRHAWHLGPEFARHALERTARK